MSVRKVAVVISTVQSEWMVSVEKMSISGLEPVDKLFDIFC